MKRTATAVALALAFLLAPTLHAANWSGWITDEHCAAKGASADHKGCAVKCAGKGAALVFYNNADKKIYKLDKQDVAKKHLGTQVVVTGKADGDTIKVSSITDKKPVR